MGIQFFNPFFKILFSKYIVIGIKKKAGSAQDVRCLEERDSKEPYTLLLGKGDKQFLQIIQDGIIYICKYTFYIYIYHTVINRKKNVLTRIILCKSV